MPIFSYRCNRCSAENDLLVARLDARDKQRCPACGSKDLTRLLAAFSVGKTARAPQCASSCAAARRHGGCPAAGTCPGAQ